MRLNSSSGLVSMANVEGRVENWFGNVQVVAGSNGGWFKYERRSEGAPDRDSELSIVLVSSISRFGIGSDITWLGVVCIRVSRSKS